MNHTKSEAEPVSIFKQLSFLLSLSLAIVSIVGLARLYDKAPPQAIGITIVFGTSLILLLNRFWLPFRKQFAAISTENLMLWHVIRAPVGVAFLVMAGEQLLPDTFAQRAGYGDILAAFLALLVVIGIGISASQRFRFVAVLTWNVVGLIDLLIAVGTGLTLGLSVVDSMIWIVRLPLLLVPTIILPVLFSTHFIIFFRLFQKNGEDK